ncbi:MAG: AraC family transcriptional regulator, partial [Angelakisella sp.]
IFFCCGGQFATIKSSVIELLVLISRAAISGGADCERTLYLSRSYLNQMDSITNIDDLCIMLMDVMNRLVDSVFVFENIRHADVIHKAIQYMRSHYTEKLSLEETARVVYLSPSYFSKIFKEETGSSWSRYLNVLRVGKSKALLLGGNLHLAEISLAVGFADQSYFTKVFKCITGVSPNQYRDKVGRI